MNDSIALILCAGIAACCLIAALGNENQFWRRLFIGLGVLHVAPPLLRLWSLIIFGATP